MLPIVYAGLTGDRVAAVAELPGVRRVSPNRTPEYYDDDSREVTGVKAVREECGYTGEGLHAAVVDSGLFASHPDVEGGVGTPTSSPTG